MRSNIVTARIAAVLFVSATAASLIDRALLSPVLGSSDYLASTFANSGRVQAGALFQIVTGMTCAGIAVTLYPVLRRYGEALALGSVVLRLMEGLLYIAGAIGALLLVSLSEQAADGETSSLRTSGALLLALRDHVSVTGTMAFYLGGTMYYYLFLASRLIPRWLSWWGIAGTCLGLTASLLVYFGVIAAFSAPQVVMNLPIFANEFVLAAWLFVKGFDTTRAAADGAPRRTLAPLST
jgi:hypothetical protein